jgi:hypothetical protein
MRSRFGEVAVDWLDHHLRETVEVFLRIRRSWAAGSNGVSTMPGGFVVLFKPSCLSIPRLVRPSKNFNKETSIPALYAAPTSKSETKDCLVLSRRSPRFETKSPSQIHAGVHVEKAGVVPFDCDAMQRSRDGTDLERVTGVGPTKWIKAES